MIVAEMIASLLAAHGVKRVVVSPGSRNAPLIEAASRQEGLRCISVLDERTAGFIGLGMAVQSGEPVALMCTSGTAMLNYGPALAEAYYRHVPLIAVTADRPLQWIDQDDSQTLRQAGALGNYVKLTADIPSTAPLTADERWMANRLVNDALLTAMRSPRGPVHINARLDLGADEPSDAPSAADLRVISESCPRPQFSREQMMAIAKRLEGRKVMIVCGFMEPNHKMTRAMARMSRLSQCAVLTESIANLHDCNTVGRIDTVLCSAEAHTPEAYPDVVITCGGALVSRNIKEYIRALPVEHWHVGPALTTIDCFRRLSEHFEAPPEVFFNQLATAMRANNAPQDAEGYRSLWGDMMHKEAQIHQAYFEACPWSDMKLFSMLIRSIPPTWNVHLSNGTPIRYAQLMNCNHLHRCDCNRGVSGIDGSTSTAIGAAIASPSRPTLLVTGDLSARYDLGAVACGIVPPNFRMIVVDNDGGDIFRFIKATAGYDADFREQHLSMAGGSLAPLMGAAEAAGFVILRADSADTFAAALKKMFAPDTPGAPVMLVASTPKDVNSRILKSYFSANEYLHNLDPDKDIH